MKKVYLLFLLVLLCVIIVDNIAVANDDYPLPFIKAFKNCSPYSYTTPEIEIFGMKVRSKKQILGVKNNACYYIEYTGPKGAQCESRCKFNRYQVNELVKAMLNNEDSGQPLSVSVDLGKNGASTSGGDSASRVWTKYLNDENVCRIFCPD